MVVGLNTMLEVTETLDRYPKAFRVNFETRLFMGRQVKVAIGEVLRSVLQIGEVVAAIGLGSAIVLAVVLTLTGNWSLANFVYSLQVLLALEGLLIALAGAFLVSGFGWINPGPVGRHYMRGSIAPEPGKRNPSLGVKMIAVGLTLFLIGLLWLSASQW